MKKLITNYTFDPIAKTVVFTDYDAIDLSQVLLITNTTDNIIIYNFACTGGTVTGNTLTLAYDTSAMDSGDSLQIYYDDGESAATESGQTTQEIMMAQLVNQLLLTLGNIAGSGNNRLTIDVGTIQNANPNVATLGNVTTVATLNNQLNQGSVSSFLTAQYLSDQYAYSYLNNITFS